MKKIFLSLRVFNGYLQNNERQIPQYLIFRCGMTQLTFSIFKLRRTFKLQQELLKAERNHDEVDRINYKNKKNEWLEYVKFDDLCCAFS